MGRALTSLSGGPGTGGGGPGGAATATGAGDAGATAACGRGWTGRGRGGGGRGRTGGGGGGGGGGSGGGGGASGGGGSGTGGGGGGGGSGGGGGGGGSGGGGGGGGAGGGGAGAGGAAAGIEAAGGGGGGGGGWMISTSITGGGGGGGAFPSWDTSKNTAPTNRWAMITIGAATVTRMALLRRGGAEGGGVLRDQANLVVARLLQPVHYGNQPAIQNGRITADEDPLLHVAVGLGFNQWDETIQAGLIFANKDITSLLDRQIDRLRWRRWCRAGCGRRQVERDTHCCDRCGNHEND